MEEKFAVICSISIYSGVVISSGLTDSIKELVHEATVNTRDNIAIYALESMSYNVMDILGLNTQRDHSAIIPH